MAIFFLLSWVLCSHSRFGPRDQESLSLGSMFFLLVLDVEVLLDVLVGGMWSQGGIIIHGGPDKKPGVLMTWSSVRRRKRVTGFILNGD